MIWWVAIWFDKSYKCLNWCNWILDLFGYILNVLWQVENFGKSKLQTKCCPIFVSETVALRGNDNLHMDKCRNRMKGYGILNDKPDKNKWLNTSIQIKCTKRMTNVILDKREKWAPSWCMFGQIRKKVNDIGRRY